jgi:hypothetical protein
LKAVAAIFSNKAKSKQTAIPFMPNILTARRQAWLNDSLQPVCEAGSLNISCPLILLA